MYSGIFEVLGSYSPRINTIYCLKNNKIFIIHELLHWFVSLITPFHPDDSIISFGERLDRLIDKYLGYNFFVKTGLYKPDRYSDKTKRDRGVNQGD
jgi:hypothetical protein